MKGLLDQWDQVTVALYQHLTNRNDASSDSG